MNNRLTVNYILFIVLSFLVIFGYTFYFSEPVKTPERDEKVSEQVVDRDKPAEAEIPEIDTEEKHTPPTKTDVLQATGEIISIETPLYIAHLDTLGSRIIRWELKNYRLTTDEDSPLVNLVTSPLKSVYSVPDIQGIELPEIIPYRFSGTSQIDVTDDPHTIELYYQADENIRITKQITIDPESYMLRERMSVDNNSNSGLIQTHLLYTLEQLERKDRSGNGLTFEVMVNNDIERVRDSKKLPDSFTGQINWFAFSEKYFIKAVLPESGANNTVRLSAVNDGLVVSEFAYPSEIIPPGSSYSKSWKLYLGPVETGSLSVAGYSLEEAVNYGWVEFLAKIALSFLKLINSVLHNYGLSIIAITVIIRVAFLPLTLKSMRSMKQMQKKMQELKPKIDALKEKYKDDKQTQNSELMKLYSSHGVNPLSSLGGCLPLLIQLPVFVALYDVLLYSIEMRHSSFLWVSDLSQPETLFTIPLIGIPFRILPLLMGVSWFISQKLTPMGAPMSDSMELQMKMMQFMPIIFTVLFWGLPSGLILYWTVSNILSIGQQLYINRRVHV